MRTEPRGMDMVPSRRARIGVAEGGVCWFHGWLVGWLAALPALRRWASSRLGGWWWFTGPVVSHSRRCCLQPTPERQARAIEMAQDQMLPRAARMGCALAALAGRGSVHPFGLPPHLGAPAAAGTGVIRCVPWPPHGIGIDCLTAAQKTRGSRGALHELGL